MEDLLKAKKKVNRMTLDFIHAEREECKRIKRRMSAHAGGAASQMHREKNPLRRERLKEEFQLFSRASKRLKTPKR